MTDPTSHRITPSRRHALARLHHHGPARYSNHSGPGSVHWQAADWLIDNGLATRTGDTITLTDTGHELAAKGTVR